MSKEMAIIALGALVIIIRTVLSVPGSWQTPLLIAAGLAIMTVGFLLRGEAIGRHQQPRATQRSATYSFVESPEPEPANDKKEGITSLN
jgi:hypothetical protein